MSVEYWYWPVAVPTVTLGEKRSMLTMRASAEKWIYVAPESVMPVVCIVDFYWLDVKVE